MPPAVVRALALVLAAFFAVTGLAVSATASVSPSPPRPARAAPHLAAPLAATTAAAVALTAAVRPGDTLSAIERRFCGHASWWPQLWLANRDKIANPDLITAGMRLRLPACGRPWHTMRVRAMAAIPRPPPARARRAAAPAVPAAPAQAAAAVPAASFTAAPGSFQACVISRESGGNPAAVNPASDAGGLYQFLPSTWAALGFAAAYPGGAQTAPVSVQNAAFAKAYAQSGTSPWAPYDGCLWERT